MGIGENFENLSKDVQEFVKRSIESYRLQLVESMSLLFGDMVCGFVVFMLLFIALLFFLVALVFVFAPFIGLPASLFAAFFFLVSLALLVYAMRVPLFVNGMVKRFMAMFYRSVEEDEDV